MKGSIFKMVGNVVPVSVNFVYETLASVFHFIEGILVPKSFQHTMIYNVPVAFLNVLLSFIHFRPVDRRYLVNIFYFVDVFLNTLAGGNCRVSISARLGRWGAKGIAMPLFEKALWRLSYFVVTETFRPLDGDNHCPNAYEWVITHEKVSHVNRGSYPSILLLTFFSVSGCILLWPTVRVLVALKILK